MDERQGESKQSGRKKQLSEGAPIMEAAFLTTLPLHSTWLFVLIRLIYCSYDWLVQQKLIFIISIMVWYSHVNTAA